MPTQEQQLEALLTEALEHAEDDEAKFLLRTALQRLMVGTE